MRVQDVSVYNISNQSMSIHPESLMVLVRVQKKPTCAPVQ